MAFHIRLFVVADICLPGIQIYVFVARYLLLMTLAMTAYDLN